MTLIRRDPCLMRQLPSGTVTFLFSDIEGSTRLLQELGESYADALAEHRRIVREVIERHAGVEVDTQGDAFFIAFARASEALAAAAEAQQALAPGRIRVRIGVHTGEPIVTEEGYVGIDVHRAARIAAAGHGGQVLVSQTTRDLLDAATELRDLGEHRLKDLSEPQRLYQLGPGDFPLLRSLYGTNLPVQPTSFVGRERELADVVARLRSARLLTLTGSGGSGKTRLALQAAAEVAAEFEDGVWFVPLAAIDDPQLLEPAIAKVLGARDQLASHLRSKRMLLLLDNFEQLVAAAPWLAELLTETQELVLLITSRERLALAAEQEYAVPTLATEEAIALFSARAGALNPSFEIDRDVAEICSRLDGLPLALELAAARAKILTSAQILERLGRRLELLTGGTRDAPLRQRTLRATIEWSHGLLDEEERRLFARLAVFTGSFSLDAAEEVVGADLDRISSLVDKSLLRQARGGRFFMLETISEFALERLRECGEADHFYNRQAEWTLALAELAEPALEGDDQAVWLDRLELERDNIRAALGGFRMLERHQDALRLATALWRLWFMRGPAAEGTRAVELALAAAPPDAVVERLAALRALGNLAYARGDWGEAATFHERALELSRRAADRRSEALALFGLLAAAMAQRELALAKRYADEAAAVAEMVSEDPRIAGVAASSLGVLALHEREYTQARALFERSIAALGDEEYALVVNLGNLALTALRLGDLDEAVKRSRENLTRALHLHDHLSTSHALEVLAAVLAARGHSAISARVLGAGAALRKEAGLSLQELEADLHDETEAAVARALGQKNYLSELDGGRAAELPELIGDAIQLLEPAVAPAE
jgi:predicted ATPase/class 3 adenylate cyclase